MAKACARIPRLRNNKNELGNSRLFIDLLSLSPNREEAVRMYLITKNADFITTYNSKINYG